MLDMLWIDGWVVQWVLVETKLKIKKKKKCNKPMFYK
jgi:hypothetical protein